MSSTTEDSKKLYLPPPLNLSKENVGVWLGWCCKGNREVSREAAVKGISVDLVIIFLSQRKKIGIEEAEFFFKNEVFKWIKELLDRKQIFRVSHILSNIGMNPLEELSKVFITTTNVELREYIGNHLISQNELNENLQQLWHFLNVILRNNLLISKWRLTEDSIDCLNKQGHDWKSEIAAKLFLRTHDILLLPFLTGEALWKQLLAYNDIKLLKVWINIYYNKGTDTLEISERLLQVFEQFSITNEMINQLNSSETSTNTSNSILDELSRFGVFCNVELETFGKILGRLYHSNNIQDTFEIFNKITSNVQKEHFLHLLVDHCVEQHLNTVLSICIEKFDISEKAAQKCRHLELILCFRQLTKLFSEKNVHDNILKVAQFLSEDLDEYFNENPLVLLSLIFFIEGSTIEKILNERKLMIQGITLTKSVENLSAHFNSFNAIMNRKNIIAKEKITFFDLLQKHYDVNIRNLFLLQFENHVPDFNNIDLVKKFGYLKKVNHLFYVKQFRPSTASKLYLMNQYEHFNCFPEGNIQQVQKKIFKIALRNVSDVELVSSCIAFLEMMGLNSFLPKVAVHSAKILLKNGVSAERVTELFLNVENKPQIILSLFEPMVIKNIKFDQFTEGSYFVEAMKTYEIVMSFSTCYKLQLPEMFLKYCAMNNMWMPFLIFAQLKNYPVDQVKLILQSFKNSNLLEHVYHSVVHDIHIEDQNVLMRERDSRNNFLSRIGLRKSLENLSQSDSMHSVNSLSSCGSNSSSTGSDFLEIDISNTKATLLQTLIRCHNSADPPRALLQACQLYKNPLLAIFATSYEPDSIITNWLTWLSVSTGLYETFTSFESVALNSRAVTSLLVNCIKHRFPKTLLQSFEIFISTNALKHFVEFLDLCIDGVHNSEILVSKLEAFVLCTSRCRSHSIISENDHEMTYLTNKVWLVNTAIDLLSSTIQYNMTSLYEQIQLLETLIEINLKKYIACPDLRNLLEILMIVYDSNREIRFNVSDFLYEKNESKAIEDCLSALLDNGMFVHAKKVASIQKIPLGKILLKEWSYKFKNLDSKNVDFWVNCNEDFKLHQVPAETVVDFFLDYVNRVENTMEKYQIIKIASQWAKNHKLKCRYELEKQKWLAYLTLEEKCRTFDVTIEEESASNLLFKDMTEKLRKFSTHQGDLPPDAPNVLKSIINNAINNGNLWLALKLEKIFNCDHPDLNILKLSYNLAEGLLQPYQLNTEQRLIVTRDTHLRRLSSRRTFLSARLSPLSSSPYSPGTSFLQPNDATDSSDQDTLAMLCTLVEKVTNGVELAQTILMTFRISINIEIPYNVIVSNGDSMKMLKDALEDECFNKLEVVHDFFCVYKWSKERIADFICEEIINSTTSYVKSSSNEFLMWDLRMDQDFHLILQLLLDNCSILGYKIYSFASATHKSQVLADLNFRINKLAMVIELLIIAHDCFTADCNMEGITIILKKCQTVISHLLTLRSWKLIVRLLTGIGRYTEMNYVFQILRENDQFEFLLSKGSKKDNGLKSAVLEYLKKYCPDNRELYKIVALYFTLFSEVALLWEREAQSIIKNLIAIAKLEMQNNKLNPDAEPFILFSNSDGTKMCLNKAIENYTHATDFHLQGEKLTKAMNSAKQAELIALQTSLLKNLQTNATALCLLNLTHAQIETLITNDFNFEQTYILVQAYDYQPDWSSVLFAQCVLRNDNMYLQSFLKHRSLTDSLVSEISRKFLCSGINNPQQINNMKAIINRLPSVHTKYRISSELSFTDVVEDLIRGEQLAYLKDTVWKRGYNN